MQRGIAAGLLGLLERRTAFLHCPLYLIGALLLGAQALEKEGER